MKYYAVTMERGHVGLGRSATITFYYKARDIFEAAAKARKQGGVKHSRFPVACKEVTKEEYCENIKISAYERAKAR